MRCLASAGRRYRFPWYSGNMGIHLQPQEGTGILASRWLTQSGGLSKAEQFFLDKWMTKTSIELRDTIGRECVRLHDVGVFDTLPNMKIIPHIETIAEAGARKFQVWIHDFRDALPDVVRSGFKSLEKLVSSKKEREPFEEIENSEFSSGFNCQTGIRTRDGLQWVEPLFYSATLTLGTPDLKHPFFATFPSMEEAAMWTFHHEAAHVAMLVRQTVNPIVVASNPLAPYADAAELKSAMEWDNKAWVNLLCVVGPGDGKDHVGLEIFQKRWGEYYADVGATLLHARSGYATQYLGPLCEQRRDGDTVHQTNPVLEELAQILDFHPIVLKETVNAEDLHSAISQAIAPQLGRDMLRMTSSSEACAMLLEQALPELVSKSQVESKGYAEMNEALGRRFPRIAMFFAKLVDGPDAGQVASSFEVGMHVHIPQSLRQQSLDQGTLSPSMT